MGMDHRSLTQAEAFTAANRPILKNTGGSISPEMSVAKLIWLYQNSPNWPIISHLFELPEFLSKKATVSLKRSICSLVCKWPFDTESDTHWYRDFLIAGGVNACDVVYLLSKFGGVVHEGHIDVSAPGELVRTLSKEAAVAFGLPDLEGISVAGPIIDAYAVSS